MSSQNVMVQSNGAVAMSISFIKAAIRESSVFKCLLS